MKPSIDPEKNQPLAYLLPQMKARAELEVTSPAFENGGDVPVLHSAYGANVSVPLEWSAGPVGTKAYAVLIEDPDATVKPLPFLHWLAWNIPADILSLPPGVPERAREPKGMQQGVNGKGLLGYTGPKPPPGDGPHRYEFQIFALDQQIDLPAGGNRRNFVAAAAGHVLAAGVLQGNFTCLTVPAER